MFWLLAASPLAFTAAARADWVDVKGKGVMNGRILEENEASVHFRDNYGEVHDVPRSDILQMERTHEGKPAGPKLAGPLLSGLTQKASGLSSPRNAASAPSKRGAQADPSAPLGAGLEAAVMGVVDAAGSNFSSALYGEPGAVRAAKWFGAGNARVRDYKKGNMALGAAGMLFILIGLLGAVYFGVLLMLKMFAEGLRWGLVFLSSSAAQFAGIFGGIAGLLMVAVPLGLNLYFVVTRWELARRPFIGQIYCLNVAIFGFLVLMLAS